MTEMPEYTFALLSPTLHRDGTDPNLLMFSDVRVHDLITVYAVRLVKPNLDYPERYKILAPAARAVHGKQTRAFALPAGLWRDIRRAMVAAYEELMAEAAA